jgi:hypothetical protein
MAKRKRKYVRTLPGEKPKGHVRTAGGKPGAKKLPLELKRIQIVTSLKQALLEVVDASAQEHNVSRSTEVQNMIAEAIRFRVWRNENPQSLLPEMIE